MEYLDIVDIESDTVIGNAPKTEIYAKKLPHRIVHVIVYRSNGTTVLQKRSEVVTKYPNMWATGACGHVSSGESYQVAAEKELFEELGVQSDLKFLGKAIYSSEQGMQKILHIYTTVYDGEFTLEDKVSGVKEFDIQELKNLPEDCVHPELLYLIKNNYFH